MSLKEHEAFQLRLGHFKSPGLMGKTILAAVVHFADQFLQLIGLVFNYL